MPARATCARVAGGGYEPVDIIILSSSPNRDGLTAACAAAAAAGASEAGAHVEQVRLNDLDLGKCRACDNGWGTCLHEHGCQQQDDFQGLHARVARADALILVTPVYWGEPSESAKAFLDRLRRCEGSHGAASVVHGKPIIAVAAAGGGGGGTITCLLSLENWIDHIGARVFDLVPVNRWTRAYKLETIRAAGAALARGVRAE